MNRQLPSAAAERPEVSNRRRKFEKRLDETSRTRVRVVSSRGRIPRKRKKYVHRVERLNYRNLIVAVMNDIERKRRAA